MIHDPAVPRRDALLRPETMAGVISQRLLGGVPVERCERTYVKYRFGESLRAVYRFDGRYVALRTGKRDGIDAPEVGAALYPFPHDRKLAALRDAPQVIERLLGAAATPQLVAYAAEQSATFACRDATGTRARLRQGAARLRRAPRLPRARRPGRRPRPARARRRRRRPPARAPPRPPARPTSTPSAPPSPPSIPQPHLNGVRPFTLRSGGSRSTRLATAADVIGRARPDVARAAARLLALLVERGDDARREPVLLHGDVNLREHAPTGRRERRAARPRAPERRAGGRGPRAGAREPDRRAHAAGRDGAAARATASPPDKAALRWYTAASLLARVALPAISRYRPDVLARLRELLDAGAALLAPAKELAA